MNRFFSFIKNIVTTIISELKKFISEVFHNIAGILILTTSAIGISSVITQIPFYVALPLWIESAAVVSFLSIIIVSFLTYIMNLQYGLQLCDS